MNAVASMISIDTNVCVRILINDASEPEQSRLARALAKTAGSVFVSQIVQVETVWVLESAYGFEKSQVLTVLQAMLANKSWVLQHTDCFVAALEQFASSNAGFADCLILAASQQENLALWTFDRKLGKLQGAQRLTAEMLTESLNCGVAL
ncbi:MAG: PIN domain-containing protein [Thiothrix sp.]|nr:MAG: PIN domain-containing protein [Thiothrix sp.]